MNILFWVVVCLLGVGAVVNWSASGGIGALFMGLMAGLLVVSVLNGASVVSEGLTIPVALAFWTAAAFWFWVVLVIGAIAIIALFLFEWEGSAFSAFAVTALLLLSIQFGPSEIGNYIWSNIGFLLVMLVFYFVVAPGVMLLRWVFFNWDSVEAHEDEVNMFYRYHSNDQARWDERVRDNWQRISVYNRPRPREHRKRLIGYMVYWPLHFIDLVIREFFWRLLKRVYQLCIPLLDRISENIAKNVSNGVSTDSTKI